MSGRAAGRTLFADGVPYVHAAHAPPDEPGPGGRTRPEHGYGPIGCASEPMRPEPPRCPGFRAASRLTFPESRLHTSGKTVESPSPRSLTRS